jgi:hypothetical protein
MDKMIRLIKLEMLRVLQGQGFNSAQAAVMIHHAVEKAKTAYVRQEGR